jgi:TPP-dependent pyruvate/acetoin dehydrogenase alpha subunit
MTATMTEFASANEGFSLVSNQKLVSLYTAMLACRRIAENYRGRPTKRALSRAAGFIRGHEAAAVGAAIDLLASDTVAPAATTDLALQAINPSVALAPSLSVAARLALKAKNSAGITLLFSNESRSSQSSWLRALTLAADHNLAVLFVSLNRAETAEEAAAIESVRTGRNVYAVPSIRVDGNDVVAVYRVASEAITHARKGHGPTLIDCRLSETGDPIENMKRYLIGKGTDPGQLAE